MKSSFEDLLEYINNNSLIIYMDNLHNSALIILEVTLPNAKTNIHHITVGSSDFSKSDVDFAESAIAYFKADKSYIEGTTFKLKNVLKFKTQEDYINFLQNQIADYLNSFD